MIKSDSTGIYEFEVEVTDGASGKSKAATYECKVSKFFDENGKLLTKAFYTDLAKYCAAVCSEEKKGKWNLTIQTVWINEQPHPKNSQRNFGKIIY